MVLYSDGSGEKESMNKKKKKTDTKRMTSLILRIKKIWGIKFPNIGRFNTIYIYIYINIYIIEISAPLSFGTWLVQEVTVLSFEVYIK